MTKRRTLRSEKQKVINIIKTLREKALSLEDAVVNNLSDAAMDAEPVISHALNNKTDEKQRSLAQGCSVDGPFCEAQTSVLLSVVQELQVIVSSASSASGHTFLMCFM